MKKAIFALTASFIFAVLTNNATAQTTSFTTVLKQAAADSNMSAVLDKPADAMTFKKAMPSATGAAAAGAGINEKAKKNFSKKFSKVTNEYWEINTDGFSASFDADGTRNLVYYDKKGNWNGYLKSYDPEMLSNQIKADILSEYHGAKITYVQEVLTPLSNGEPTYLLHLEDKKNLYKVRYNNGYIDTWKQYEKQQ